MHAHEVTADQSFVKRYVLDPGFLAADSTGMPEIVRFLNTLDVFVVLVRRVVAENVHVEAGTFLNHGQADSARADDGDRLSGDFIAEEGQGWVPESPFVLAREMLGTPQLAGESAHHEEGEFRGCLCENVGGIREWNVIAVRVGAVDVVEAHGILRDYLKIAFPGVEEFRVDLVPKGGDQAINPRLELFDDQAFWRRLRIS